MKKQAASNKQVRAWVIWALSSIFLFYKYVIEVSPSIMTGYLMKEYQIDGAGLGSLAATYFYAYLIMQIPAGLLLDKIGPRVTTTIAILCCAIGSLIFGMSDALLFATIGRFITGIGAAFAAVNCFKLLTNWFPMSRFAMMAGLMMTVGMLGAVGGQAPLAKFVSIFGERESIQLFALLGVVLAVVFFVVVKDHKDPVIIAHQKTQKIKPFTILTKIFSSKQSWVLSIYSGLAFAPISTFGGLWGVPFFEQAYRVSHVEAAHFVSMIFLGFALGAPLSGWFSDLTRSRKKVMTLGTAVSFVLLCVILYVPISRVEILNGTLFLFGATLSCFLVSFTMIRETHRPIMAATAIGFMNSFDAFFASFTDPLTGYILDKNWSGKLAEGAAIFSSMNYRISLTLLPLFLLLSLIMLLFIKETYKKGHVVPESFP
ncbi:MAG: MFS transporter [Rhabdochlamydiaceae bacterium]|nr:MFS transporter [Candidatus Amphrikana amoebophyrae]